MKSQKCHLFRKFALILISFEDNEEYLEHIDRGSLYGHLVSCQPYLLFVLCTLHKLPVTYQ